MYFGRRNEGEERCDTCGSIFCMKKGGKEREGRGRGDTTKFCTKNKKKEDVL